LNDILTGGAGHITAPTTENLLAAGQKLTVVSRNVKPVAAFVAIKIGS
jgi:NAD(P)-dependent dehydrogenase (short-subunit alcohol dehydrogenase family)